MNQKLEQLADEVGATDFRPANTTMTLDQAKRFSDAAESKVASTRFDSDDEFFDVWGTVLEDWPDIEVRFAGMIGEYGYLDAVYLVYDTIPDWHHDEIEEYCVVHFKNWLPLDPQENKGVCPVCDDRVDADVRDEDLACRDFDGNLWAAPDEFDFRQNDEWGRYLRLWWDD
jgi:hypothetical protein